LVKAANQTGFGDEFYYEADYHVLICKTHGLGVVGLEKHLKDKHGLLKKERQPILERYAGLAITTTRCCTPANEWSTIRYIERTNSWVLLYRLRPSFNKPKVYARALQFQA